MSVTYTLGWEERVDQSDLGLSAIPGLEGIEASTGIDVADQVNQFLATRVQQLSKQKDALRVR